VLTNKCILRTEKIVKSFPGTKALNGVSIQLNEGEIHAIVGENGAGKSTLMNIISGVFSADSGKILVNEKEVHFRNTHDAQMAGVGIVHQELALCTHVTVADNIYIGRLPEKAGIVDRKRLYEMAEEALRPFMTDIKPDQIVSDLSVAQQQIIEIAKVLSLNCKVVIFDEPTSSLNEKEAQILFGIIQSMAKQGVGIFYISHKLSEIFFLCHKVTVLRDGSYITSNEINNLDADHVVSQMVGRDVGKMYPDKSELHSKEELMKVEGVTRTPHFSDVSFSLKSGEILGLCGLVGSGRTELARAICGIDKKTAGTIYIKGTKLKKSTYAAALSRGLCYLSEDRKLDGLFLNMDVSDNMIAPQVDAITKRKLLDRKRIAKLVQKYKEELNIIFSSPNQEIKHLSGGNQQKIMIAKLLAISPKVIILDEPTRGIDVGAKSEIHRKLRELCKQGIGIVVISSEMSEIVGLCDHIVVMNIGRVVSELRGEEITQDNVIGEISRVNENRRVSK